MKKFFSIVIAAIALVSFYSCEKQEQIANDIKDEVSSNFDGTIVFESAKPEVTEEVGTKTVWTGSSVQWKAGDKIRVGFTLDGEWQSGIEGDSSPRLFASNDLKDNVDIAEFSIPTVASGNTSFQADYMQSLEGDLVFYGLYPSSCTSSATQTNAPDITITVPAEQKPSAESFDPSADILVGKTETLEAVPTDPVLMDWTRIVALADITLKELSVPAGENLLRLTLTAQADADLVGTHTLNLEELAVVDPDGATNEIVLNISSLSIASDNTMEVWVGLLPKTITSLTVVLETDVATYTKAITGISKTFVQNKRNKLGIKMTGAERVAKENVNPYALKETSNVSLEKGDNASDATVNGFEAVKVGTGKTAGTMSVTVPSGSTKLHIHAAGWKGTDNCVLTISGADLTPSSIHLNNDDGISNNTPFTLAGSVDDYYYAIELTGITSDKEITFTATSTGKRFVIWGVNVEPEPAEVNTPTLTFNNPTTTVNVGDKVTNIATIDPDDLTVTYSSSAESVATVNASTGEVTGVAAGTATITATFAGNEEYSAVTATYDITVINPGENDGSAEKPYSASEAAEAASFGYTDVYVKGILSRITTAYSSDHENISFTISDDGLTSSTQFTVYRMSTTSDDFKVGDIVVVKGNLKVYNNTPELDAGCTLISQVKAPRFDPEGKSFATESLSVSLSADSGATIRYTVDGTTPTAESGTVYGGAITLSATTTVKAIAILNGEVTGVAAATYTKSTNGTENDPYSASEAVEAASFGYTDVYVKGIISQITTAYSSEYNNISFTISDDGLTSSTQFTVYRMSTTSDDFKVGDIVVVKGNLKVYNNTPELDAGCTLISQVKAPRFDPEGKSFATESLSVSLSADSGATIRYTVDGTTPTAESGTVYGGAITLSATTTVKAIAILNGEVTGVAAATYTKGASTTIPVNIAQYAADHSWSNGVLYPSITLDDNITAEAIGGGNTGKYYTSGNEWRFYQNNSAILRISASNEKKITSVKLTFNVTNGGQLKYGNTVVSSGVAITLDNVSSAEFTVGNSSSATNGQVKFTAIEVTYN